MADQSYRIVKVSVHDNVAIAVQEIPAWTCVNIVDTSPIILHRTRLRKRITIYERIDTETGMPVKIKFRALCLAIPSPGKK